MHGSGRFPGVTAVKNRDSGGLLSWQAQISVKGQQHYLGTFNTQQEAALATCLAQLARARPLAVVIEDCEHIDNASCAVLQRLFDEHLGTGRLFLLLGVRSSEGVTDERMRGWLDSERTTHVELGPLPPGEARALVAASAPAGRLPEQVTEHILNMSEGVPLNLQQMTRAFVGSDMLFLGGDGCYELEGAEGGGEREKGE